MMDLTREQSDFVEVCKAAAKAIGRPVSFTTKGPKTISVCIDGKRANFNFQKDKMNDAHARERLSRIFGPVAQSPQAIKNWYYERYGVQLAQNTNANGAAAIPAANAFPQQPKTTTPTHSPYVDDVVARSGASEKQRRKELVAERRTTWCPPERSGFLEWAKRISDTSAIVPSCASTASTITISGGNGASHQTSSSVRLDSTVRPVVHGDDAMRFATKNGNGDASHHSVSVKASAAPEAQAEPVKQVPRPRYIYDPILEAGGFVNVAALTAAMNATPEVAAMRGNFDVTVQQVKHALMNPQLAFGDSQARLGLIYHRITQTINAARFKNKQGEITTETLFGFKKPTNVADTAEAKLTRSRRFMHDGILNALDHFNARHIQTSAQLLSGSQNPQAVRHLLQNPHLAYVADEDGKAVANPALRDLAHTLETKPDYIITPRAWSSAYEAVYGEKPLDITAQRSRTTVPPKHTPKPITGPEGRGTIIAKPVQSILGAPAEPAAPIAAVQPTAVKGLVPAAVKPVAPPPPAAPAADQRPAAAPVKRAAPATAIKTASAVAAKSATTKSADFNAAAVEVLKAYRNLTAPELTLLRKVDGINLSHKIEPLADVGARLGYDEVDDTEVVFKGAREKLIDAARKAGVETTNEKIVDALRVFEADSERIMLTASIIDGETDRDIGRRFSPVVSEEKIQIARTALLNRIAAALKPA